MQQEIPSDELLLHRMQAGDRPAFDALYRRYWRTLYDAAYKRLGNRQQAEDVIQDVFLRLWVRRAGLDIENLPAYLHKAVRYQVFNYITRQKVSYSFFEPFEALISETTADASLLAKEIWGLVEDFAAMLPAKRRAIFLLHIRQKLSSREIAHQLDISQKTVQNQLHAAMQDLRKKLVPVIILLLYNHL